MKWMLWGIVAAVLLVYVVQGVMLLYHVRVGKALAETAKPFERTQEDAELRVLFVGDSTVVGTGASAPEFSTAGQFATKYPMASVENLGVNGMKLAEVVPRLAAAQHDHYDLIVMQAGGNDIMFWSDLEEVEQQVPEIVQELQVRADAVVLLHSGNVGATRAIPHGLGAFGYYERRTLRMRALYQQQAETHENVFYVDLFIPRGEEGSWNSNDYYAADLFHPSDKGYASWFERMEPVIAQALANK